MGSYQSRSSQMLQDVWRDEWEKSYDEVDAKLLADVRALTSTTTEWPDLHKAVIGGDLERLQALCSAADFTNHLYDKKTDEGWTLLHIAVVSKTPQGAEITRFLTSKAWIDPGATTRNGFTALHLACCVGDESQVAALLTCPRIRIDCKGYHNVTPLHVSAAFGHERIVRVLLQANARVGSVDKNSFTALHVAAHFGHTRVLDTLLSAKADVEAKSQNGDTALHLACYQDHQEAVELLISKYNANVNCIDKEKMTPLHYCCRRGYLSLTKFLLANGADVKLKNVYGDLVIHCACYNGWVGICQALIEFGISVKEENIYSETPLHAACTFGATRTLIDYLLSQPGVDINHQGRDGHTPLHSACFNGHFHVVKILLEYGANFKIEDKQKEEPIKWAFEKGYDKIVELLRSCYDSDEQIARFETPSPLGMIRHVTQEKANLSQLRDILADLQININEVDFYEVIGQGSFGSVYKGKYLNKTIAIKKLRTGAFRGRADVEKFCREVKILSEIDHPNVVHFVGASTREPSQLCIMTEYAKGGSLHAVLHKQNRLLDIQRKLEIAMDVAKGMHYLHSREIPIIHRDLNPHNILLNDKGTALVADFGESRLILKKGDDEMTKQSGNLRYMAPEVFIQRGTYTVRADVFNYGLCLWELLAERIPFEDLLPAAAAAEMAYNKARPFIPDYWAPELREIIEKCWQEDAESRPTFDKIITMLQNEKLRTLTGQTALRYEHPEGSEIADSPGELRGPTSGERFRRQRSKSNSDYVTNTRPFFWQNGGKSTVSPTESASNSPTNSVHYG